MASQIGPEQSACQRESVIQYEGAGINAQQSSSIRRPTAAVPVGIPNPFVNPVVAATSGGRRNSISWWTEEKKTIIAPECGTHLLTTNGHYELLAFCIALAACSMLPGKNSVRGMPAWPARLFVSV
jgi:hypothetical protein